MILGNDVSKYQGSINWDTYKNNTNFCFIKASEGAGATDGQFPRNQSEARRTGVALGYYHFARPDLGNSPEGEVDYFLNTIGPLNVGEFMALDYECPNQKPEYVDWCLKFLNRVNEKTGVKPFIYLNQSQIKAFDWTPVVNSNYALWVAAYTYDPKNNTFFNGEFTSVAMQQWTNGQTVPGIPAVVDGDVFFGDLNALKKYGFQSLPQPTTPPAVINDQTKIDLGDLGIMEVQQIKSVIKDGNATIQNLQSQLSAVQANCQTQVKEAVTSTIAERNSYWQTQMDSAKKEFDVKYNTLLTQTTDSLSAIQLISLGMKKLWAFRKSRS